MSQKLLFKLVRAAKSNGGDRYETTIPSEPKPVAWYFPQALSRDKGQPREFIEVTVHVPTTKE